MRFDGSVIFGLALVSALTAAAMPTKEQFQKVLPMVRELSADDNAAVKAGKMKPLEAGDNAFARAKDQSLDEASRYLFFEAAFAHYVRAAEYDKAVEVVESLRSTVKDVPDAALIEFIERRLRKVPRKHAGQLYGILRDARVRERVNQKVAVYRKAAAANPSDTIPQTRLGASYVLLNDWPNALNAFAKCGGELAKAAKADADGKGMEPDALGDLWWAYKVHDTDFTDYAETLDDAIKAHAAGWYRKALETGKLAGVRRQLVEKRIADYPENGSAVAQPAEAPVKLRTLDLDLGKGVKMEFVECPAGSFMMGIPGDNDERSIFREHKVNITRPFYMSKYPVTMEQLCVFCKRELGAVDKIIGPKQIVASDQEERETIFKALNQKFRSKVPRGYLFRLPTEAEYAYAMNADTTDPNDCYYRPNIFRAYSKRMVTVPELKEMIKNAGGKFDESDKFCVKSKDGGKADRKYPAVGQRCLNRWGLGDFTNCLMLDGFSAGGGFCPHSGKNLQDVIQYAEEETDPLRTGAIPMRWTEFGFYFYKWLYSEAPIIPFRLVIGPDLLKEKQSKRK